MASQDGAATPRRKTALRKISSVLSPRSNAAKLPEHWHVRHDEFGREFYWNSETFEQTVERPQTHLPMGWHERRDPATGLIYYYNFFTRETRPAPKRKPLPPPPPPGQAPPTVEEFVRSRRESVESVAAAASAQPAVQPGAGGAAVPQLRIAELNATGARAVPAAVASDVLHAPTLQTPRAAAMNGVPVSVDPFSLSSRWNAANSLSADQPPTLTPAPPGPPPGPPPEPPSGDAAEPPSEQKPGPGQPAAAASGAKDAAPPSTPAPDASASSAAEAPKDQALVAELDAATKIQAHRRGSIERKSIEDLRDEKARLQWIDFYLSRGMYKQAREMCWEPETEEEAQAEAATLLQAAHRGLSTRKLDAAGGLKAKNGSAPKSLVAPATVVKLVNAAAASTDKREAKEAAAEGADAPGEGEEKASNCSLM